MPAAKPIGRTGFSRPERSEPPSFQRRQMIRLAVTLAAAAGAGGYLLANLDDAALMPWLPRTLVTVAAVAFLLWIEGIRLARQIARAETGVREDLAQIDERLKTQRCKACYAEGYVDGVTRRPPLEDGTGERHLRSV